MRILEITASNRREGSLSRSLSREFIKEWLALHPQAAHIERDVGTQAPTPPTAFVSAAVYTPPNERTPAMTAALEPSSLLIEEFLLAERIVIATPIYNFSVPATFKEYIDNIIRVGSTFSFDPKTFSFRGLATGKKALLIITSAGDYRPGTAQVSLDFCTPYLRMILGFVGISDVEIVTAPNQFKEEPVRSEAGSMARLELRRILPTW